MVQDFTQTSWSDCPSPDKQNILLCLLFWLKAQKESEILQVLEIALSCLSISLLSALFSPPSHCHFPGLSPGLLQQLPNYSLCIQSFSPVIQFALSFKTSKTPESHLPAVDPSKVSTDCRINSKHVNVALTSFLNSVEFSTISALSANDPVTQLTFFT